MRGVLLVLACLTTSGAAFAQGDRLADVYACLDKKLAAADSSTIAVPRLVSVAMRDCNVEVEQYLRNFERQSVLVSRSIGAAPTASPPGASPGATPRDGKAAREKARREIVEAYERRVAEQRAKRKRS